jgi:TRAP-type C4-dicarboxylate transport system permease small subunit
MYKIVTGVSRLIELIIAILLALMVILVFSNVVLRYGFNSGITVSEELSRWFFVWMIFLGAVVAIKERAHLGTDMLVSRLPAFGKKFCLVLTYSLMIYITALFFKGSWDQAIINLDVEAPVTGASVAWFYGSGIVFSVLTEVLLFAELYRVLAGKMSDKELVMVKESEEQGEFEELQAQLAREDAELAKLKK